MVNSMHWKKYLIVYEGENRSDEIKIKRKCVKLNKNFGIIWWLIYYRI